MAAPRPAVAAVNAGLQYGSVCENECAAACPSSAGHHDAGKAPLRVWAMPYLIICQNGRDTYVPRLRSSRNCSLIHYMIESSLPNHWRSGAIKIHLCIPRIDLRAKMRSIETCAWNIETEGMHIQGTDLRTTVEGALVGVAWQLLLGGPFLVKYPGSYFSRAFDFSRLVKLMPTSLLSAPQTFIFKDDSLFFLHLLKDSRVSTLYFQMTSMYRQ